MDKPQKTDEKTQEKPDHLKIQEQIARNNEWIEKMSPVVKYKIQEYVRKQRAKKQQRRKFSLACGLAASATNKSPEKRAARVKRAHSSAAQQSSSNVDTPKSPSPCNHSIASRRKSAPPQRMDLDSLNDLE